MANAVTITYRMPVLMLAEAAACISHHHLRFGVWLAGIWSEQHEEESVDQHGLIKASSYLGSSVLTHSSWIFVETYIIFFPLMQVQNHDNKII